MAPKKKVQCQYGSRKRPTPAERLYNLQYRMQKRMEDRTKGDMPPPPPRYKMPAIVVSTPKRRSTPAPAAAAAPLQQEDEEFISLLDMIDAHPCNKMDQAAPEPSDYQNAVSPHMHDHLMSARLPRLQSDKNIYIQQSIRTHITTTEPVTRNPETAPVQPPPPTHHHHTGPFRFLNLDPSIRTRILQFLFHRKNIISPTYNAGSVQAPERHTQHNQNVDTALLRANKRLHADAARILYAENTFSFTNNPAVALWFLQRIGPTNLAHIRSANFALDTGDANEAFGVRKEKLWLIFFTWLKPRQQLRKLVLSFRNWRGEHVPERDAVMWVLSGYRGVEHVTIKSLEGYDAEALKRAMLMKEGEMMSWPVRREKRDEDCERERGRSMYRSR